MITSSSRKRSEGTVKAVFGSISLDLAAHHSIIFSIERATSEPFLRRHSVGAVTGNDVYQQSLDKQILQQHSGGSRPVKVS
jgi:hypothetical protein